MLSFILRYYPLLLLLPTLHFFTLHYLERNTIQIGYLLPTISQKNNMINVFLDRINQNWPYKKKVYRFESIFFLLLASKQGLLDISFLDRQIATADNENCTTLFFPEAKITEWGCMVKKEKKEQIRKNIFSYPLPIGAEARLQFSFHIKNYKKLHPLPIYSFHAMILELKNNSLEGCIIDADTCQKIIAKNQDLSFFKLHFDKKENYIGTAIIIKKNNAYLMHIQQLYQDLFYSL
jgi:hypothetical protein